MFITICVALFLCGLCAQFLRCYQYVTKNLPPGPFRLPVLGNFLQFLANYNPEPWVALDNLSKVYGDVYSLTIGNFYGIVLCSFESMHELLDKVEWSGKITNDFTTSRSFGKELGLVFVSNPSIWYEMRKFSLRTLRDFGFGKSLSMQGVIEAELTDILHDLDNSLAQSNGILEIRINFLLSILNVTWSMIAGVRYSHSDPRLIRMMENNFAATKLQTLADPIYILLPWVRKVFPGLTKEHFRQKLISEMHQFAKELIKERRKEEAYLREPDNFIDAFLRRIHESENMITSDEKGKCCLTVYTEEQLIMMIEDFFQIGSTTTSATLNWALLYMIKYPEIQRKMQQEIDSIVAPHLIPTIDDIKKMPFTQATILEIHRKSNVVPNPAPRVLSRDYCYRGWHVPKGTYILSNHYSVMMSKDIWGDPNSFRPERFLNSSGEFIHDKRVIHFGFGQRFCLAAGLVNNIIPIYLTTLLQKYTFSVVSGEAVPTMKPEIGFSLSPMPFRMLVEKRSRTN